MGPSLFFSAPVARARRENARGGQLPAPPPSLGCHLALPWLTGARAPWLTGEGMASVRPAGGRFRGGARAACVALLVVFTSAASPPPHHSTCTVSVTPSPGGAWTTAAGDTVSAWEVDVASASHVDAPWRLGLTADRAQVAGVLQAWNLHGVKVKVGGGEDSLLTVTGDAPAPWQALAPGGRHAARVGLVVSLSANETGASLPTSATLNGAACTVVTGPRKAAVVSEEADGAQTSDAQRPPAGMTTRDGQIIGPDGKPLFFVGLNWFGFDCGATSAFG